MTYRLDVGWEKVGNSDGSYRGAYQDPGNAKVETSIILNPFCIEGESIPVVSNPYLSNCEDKVAALLL